MSETTYLVTGGAGFLGSALVRSLVGSGTGNVVNIDKLTWAGNLDPPMETLSRAQKSAPVADPVASL